MHARFARSKMKITLFTFLLSTLIGSMAHAQSQELRWGEFGYYCNWDRKPYEIDSNYEFIGRLPDLRDFPKLLDAVRDPKINQTERAVIVSQLRTLSRCDFERPLNRNADAEFEHSAAVAKWKDWWNNYGRMLSEALTEKGRRYENAWIQVAPTPYLEIPTYPILIPKSWSTTISFRSGDYGGITEEVIEFSVTEDSCSLMRRFRTGGTDKNSWTREVWRDFSRKEADHFFASLVYLIDNPWFFASDELSASEDGEEPSKIGQIRGRPKAWTDYYPSCEWTGILDADKRIVINHDPRNWDSIDHALGPKTSLDGGGLGIVFRLVRDLFPDPSWDAESSRWKRMEPSSHEVKEGRSQ
jgi:hypothetical protein